MNAIKRFASLLAVVMIMCSMMATTVFAGNGKTCESELDGAKKYFGIDDLTCTENLDEYPYSTSYNGFTYYAKERFNVDSMGVRMDSGKLNLQGFGKGDTNSWNNLFARYRTVVVGVSGIGAITMIVFFILNFMKLGSSAGNPQARSQALTGVLWTGLAAAGLGAVTIIAGFFYNAV